ncbi:hypothetical protein SLEP1_g7173 [Rubroshorea leprosula]|uniref:t-SNARE coiled-coil homology domain-containing protein n=1 Tax=Rubroshorea leprosula TaxID=152421 RepID=A0AAV5HXH9_9ROSI|nr:hypothetical protein SLEP1_g7173 [Rubroshorea leprosula]
MSVIDILFRVDEICKKYDRYDVDKQRQQNAYGDDAFARLYAQMEEEIDKAVQKAEMISMEKNRAAAVAMSAEVRRLKARLMEEIPKLQKLAKKKVKGLSEEEQEARVDLVFALSEKIKEIQDGTMSASKQTGGWGASSSNKNILFDSFATTSDTDFDNNFFEQSEESSQFRQEYERRKMKQDQGLDVISEGLDTLKCLAQDMNEELDRQVPLMDEIETKVDKTTGDLRKTNVKLKETVNRLRSSRNFCIDIILLCVFLGVASYLYNILK